MFHHQLCLKTATTLPRRLNLATDGLSVSIDAVVADVIASAKRTSPALEANNAQIMRASTVEPKASEQLGHRGTLR